MVKIYVDRKEFLRESQFDNLYRFVQLRYIENMMCKDIKKLINHGFWFKDMFDYYNYYELFPISKFVMTEDAIDGHNYIIAFNKSIDKPNYKIYDLTSKRWFVNENKLNMILNDSYKGI